MVSLSPDGITPMLLTRSVCSRIVATSKAWAHSGPRPSEISSIRRAGMLLLSLALFVFGFFVFRGVARAADSLANIFQIALGQVLVFHQVQQQRLSRAVENPIHEFAHHAAHNLLL